MAWCPKCRNEYSEDVTVCKDCNEQLIDSLEEYDKTLLESQFNSRQEVIVDEIPNYEPVEDEFDEEESLTKHSCVYIKKEEKYKDMLSSAYTLLIVGFGGLVILLLIVTDIINLHLAAPGKYVTYSGMAIMLVIFIMIGLSSLKTSNKLAKEADSENQLTNDILEWSNKNITSELIDNGITDDMVEEIKYFKRIDNVKEIIHKAYGDLNEDYLDKIAEDIYQEKNNE